MKPMKRLRMISPNVQSEGQNFFELKPRYVKPIQLHDTCCCMYHENFESLLKVKNTAFDLDLLRFSFKFQSYRRGIE